MAFILPTISKQERQKRGIITAGFIILAYEGISSFLHYKRQKALHKVVQAMENKVHIQHTKNFYLEDSMVLYGIYNSNTLETLIDIVHRLHNQSTWNEKNICGRNRKMVQMVLISKRCKSLCNKFITPPDHRFINQLRMYSQVIRVLSKGHLPISFLPPSKLNTILQEEKEALQVNNRDYNLVINRLYLYYDMKLVTFGIDDQRNLIIQFLVFVQPYTPTAFDIISNGDSTSSNHGWK